MKILNQITDDIFTIKLDEEDKQEYTHVAVAHDYVRFIGSDVIRTAAGTKIDGPHSSCSNGVRVRCDVTIHIHDMIRLIMPYLQQHKYLQEEHLHREGRAGSCYTYCGEQISMWLPTGRMVEKSYTDKFDGTTHNWTEEEFKRHFFVREEFEDDYIDMTPEEYEEYMSIHGKKELRGGERNSAKENSVVMGEVGAIRPLLSSTNLKSNYYGS